MDLIYKYWMETIDNRTTQSTIQFRKLNKFNITKVGKEKGKLLP